MNGKTNTGGGASLNYKIISGTSRPSSGGGDTLTWDGNTEGLLCDTEIGGGTLYYKVSNASVEISDIAENSSIVISADGQEFSFSPSLTELVAGVFQWQTDIGGVIFISNSGGATVGKEPGVYFPGIQIQYGASLTIPNYTGFGGGASVKENTIWVNTNTKITSHAFSATQPENPADGMVWFKTGVSSSVTFNALKKNSIEVCVIGCQQYVSGAWDSKTAQTYIGGEWKDFYVFLYNKGDFCEIVTGGWESKSGKISLDTAKAPTITENADSVTISITGYGEGYYRPINKIDLTNVNKLVWDADVTVSYKVRLRVFASSLTTEAAELSYSSTTNKTIHELDVSSLSGEYYVAICIATGNSGKSTVTMRDLRME